MREALIKTIGDIHPPYNEIESHLIKIHEYMKQFKNVISLNYDLIFYWAMLKDKETLGNWFKDCFTGIDGQFNDDIYHLYEPLPPATGATLVFYPHGNLALARINDEERKIKCSPGKITSLLETIIEKWKSDDCTPLFVCEGETKHKDKAIKASPYLNFIYKEILPKLTKSLVIYGWSMDDNDNHILIQLKTVTRIAVSVHQKNPDYIKHADEVLREQGIKDITFFDTASPGCWNNGWNNE